MKASLLLTGLLALSTSTWANQPLSMTDLLDSVKQGHRQDNAMNQERLATFRLNTAEQSRLLQEIKRQRQAAESLSQERELTFEQNEQELALLQQRLTERLGSLKELFGVLQMVASDASSNFDSSLVQMHYPGRSDEMLKFANKMEQTVELPSIGEIEQLWFELHREMTESGRVVTSNQPVLLANGQEMPLSVTRLGTFNVVADGHYLQRVPETGQLLELQRQPAQRYMLGAELLGDNSDKDVLPVTLDPIRGQILSLLGTAPKLSDRVHQGGVIGYIIIGLGIVVVLLALGKLALLLMEESRIKRQMKHPETIGNNALGRVIGTYQTLAKTEIDTLELKLTEAVMREVPKINRGLPFIKISAAVAPLMGLLGTVIGMIITFQAITLFGAGDPKLMAGGISQALVTTVLGLCVAIPSLLLHNLVQGKAGKLTEILEQEAVAMVAQQAEEQQESPYAHAA